MNRVFCRVCLVCALSALALLLSGCGDESEPQSRVSRTSREWKVRYENLVRQKEQKDERIEQLEQQKEDLEKQMATLQGKMEEEPPEAAQLQAARKQLAGHEETIGQLRQTAEDLRNRVENLRQEMQGAEEKQPPKEPEKTESQGETQEELKSVRQQVRAAGRALKKAGGELLDAGRHAAARDALAPAAELDPADPVTLYRLAYCHGVLGDAGKAADFYGRAIRAAQEGSERTAPLLPRLHSNYGATLVQLGRHAEALNAYKRAVEADPDYAPVHYNLGRLYARHLGRPRKAIEAYRRHVALGGDRGVSAREAIAELMDATE
jgi:tetratricopeptide (TPR) repeat protein